MIETLPSSVQIRTGLVTARSLKDGFPPWGESKRRDSFLGLASWFHLKISPRSPIHLPPTSQPWVTSIDLCCLHFGGGRLVTRHAAIFSVGRELSTLSAQRWLLEPRAEQLEQNLDPLCVQKLVSRLPLIDQSWITCGAPFSNFRDLIPLFRS
jgi:hypothetical protein